MPTEQVAGKPTTRRYTGGLLRELTLDPNRDYQPQPKT